MICVDFKQLYSQVIKELLSWNLGRNMCNKNMLKLFKICMMER